MRRKKRRFFGRREDKLYRRSHNTKEKGDRRQKRSQETGNSSQNKTGIRMYHVKLAKPAKSYITYIIWGKNAKKTKITKLINFFTKDTLNYLRVETQYLASQKSFIFRGVIHADADISATNHESAIGGLSDRHRRTVSRGSAIPGDQKHTYEVIVFITTYTIF